jgi:hypothetical protein
MTAGAWRGLRKHWRLPTTTPLLAQRFLAGPWFSALDAIQAATTVERRRQADLSDFIVVLGYWRSGTTLLHNYLSLDERFGFPRTYACMNSQHFLLTQAAALQGAERAVLRPMDDVQISATSPQEEEFALLALGARSPYEALLAPSALGAALRLGDPLDLSQDECRQWQDTFEYFLRGVCTAEGFRPLILKSPPHGYRVKLLLRLLPRARFVLIVRSPAVVYESTVRMWRKLFELYSLEDIPPEDETRGAVLQDRPRFEAKLATGLAELPAERLALVRYEDLVRDPISTVGAIYEQLRLGGFPAVRAAMAASIERAGQYTARNATPPTPWLRQLRTEWRTIFERYGYSAD